MSRVYYGQPGYVGCSMSERAWEAYENGEMPKSKWTKTAILEAVEDACRDLGLSLSSYDLAKLAKMKKTDLWNEFIEWKSWHHTGKYANETDFYGVNFDACEARWPHAVSEAKEYSEAAAEILNEINEIDWERLSKLSIMDLAICEECGPAFTEMWPTVYRWHEAAPYRWHIQEFKRGEWRYGTSCDITHSSRRAKW